MGDIELLLNHASTRKILSLAKDLSDTKLEASIHRTLNPQNKSPRKNRTFFNKHPRNFSDESINFFSDESSGSPVIYNRNKPYTPVVEKPTFKIQPNDSGDESSEDDVNAVETIYKNKRLLMSRKDIKNTENCNAELNLPCVKFASDDDEDDDNYDITIRKTPSDLIREAQVVRRRTIKSSYKSERLTSCMKGKKPIIKSAVDACPGNCESPRVEQKFVMDRRVKSVIEKSLKSLEDIRVLMEFGIPAPDGAEDFQRRKKRALEFSTRFARIYLYQLNRQIKEIQSMLNPTSARNNRAKFFNLNQKMLASFQIILQGLQAYYGHLPTSIAIGVPEKLKELLTETCLLCDIYRDHSDTTNDDAGAEVIIDVLEVRCKSLLEKVEIDTKIISKTILLPNNDKSNLSVLGYKVPSIPKDAKTRFAMYHKVPLRKDAYWKRTIAVLAHKKFNVASRYKTATLAHRPPPVPVEAPVSIFKQIRHMQGNQKTLDKKSSCTLKSRSIKSRFNDDNVETMVQVQDKKETDEATHDLVECHKNTLKNLAQQLFEKVSKDNESMTQAQYECILEHFVSMVHENKQQNNDLPKFEADNCGESIEKKAQNALETKLGKPIEEMEFPEIFKRLLSSAKEENKLVCEIERPKSVQSLKNIPDEIVVANACSIDLEKKSQKSKKAIVTSISGDKNAQLICIRDDRSLKETSETEEELPRPSKISLKTRKSKSSSKPSDAGDSSELVYKERRDLTSCTGSKIILNRLSKQNLRQLEMLPQENALKIIQYKLDFYKNSKENYMYKKCKDKSPWLLMGRISDKLLEESMTIVTRDIQVDGILQKIYANEFK